MKFVVLVEPGGTVKMSLIRLLQCFTVAFSSKFYCLQLFISRLHIPFEYELLEIYYLISFLFSFNFYSVDDCNFFFAFVSSPSLSLYPPSFHSFHTSLPVCAFLAQVFSQLLQLFCHLIFRFSKTENPKHKRIRFSTDASH